MAKRAIDSNRRAGRRNFAAWLMTLLPGFMFLGLLAPAAVSVKPKAEETYGPISFRNFAPRRPLRAPLTLANALSGTTIDTGVMFSGARYSPEQARQVEFDAATNDEDSIVLAAANGVDDYVSESLFGAAGDEVQLRVDLVPAWNPAVFDVIPGLIARDGWQEWDDFHGTSPGIRPRPVVIPEPATGALLAIGLGALALRRRTA